MSSNDSPIAPPAYINVHVTALPGRLLGGYDITCKPDPIPISSPTIINFQLIPPTHPGIVFSPKIEKNPDGTHQLSIPSVSTDGRMLTVSNVHTVMETLNVTLHVTSPDGRDIGFDPQIQNEPQCP
jgi:hypothetical protein